MKNVNLIPRSFAICFLTLFSLSSFAQDNLEKELATPNPGHQKVKSTFKSTKLINGHSNETLYKSDFDFKVDHRFGDIAGKNGGIQQFFGIDNSTDIRIGFEYGLSDRLTVGLARAKGATAVRQLYEGSLKFRLLEQTMDDQIPIAVTLFGSNTIAAVKASTDPTSPIAYSNLSDRMNYVGQVIIARKFSPKLSFEVLPTYIHRNYTAFRDQNTLFAIGAGGRMKFSKRMALVVDYFLPFRNSADKAYLEAANAVKFYDPLGVGLEIETGGHVFHINFTNATAIEEMQLIPSTTSSWTKGQYRWGFSIARRFSFAKKESVPK
jgi:predicted porin